MQIEKLIKLQMRNPAAKPKKPAPGMSSIFGNEMLNWPVINVYDMPCKIKKTAIAVPIIVRTLQYGASATMGIFAIVGQRKMAK